MREKVSNSSLAMEVEAIDHAFSWFASVCRCFPLLFLLLAICDNNRSYPSICVKVRAGDSIFSLALADARIKKKRKKKATTAVVIVMSVLWIGVF